MWKITLCCNVLLLFLLWLISWVVITPISNLLVQYAETQMPLPILTDFAVRIVSLTSIIPFSWGGLTLILGWWLRSQAPQSRQQWLLLHLSVTACIGLAVLFFFALAAILPILKFGAIL